MTKEELIEKVEMAEITTNCDGDDYVVLFKLDNGIELDFAVATNVILQLAFDGLVHDIENDYIDIEDYLPQEDV